ncbi:MAG: putative site-specific recombinase [Parcubacteria bacterium C7867-003]|nr:MAG: putative site-specific recombinase [Parcubacteria bacterium C7867-003]
MDKEPKYAIIDCRVSDPQQLKGGSLQDQEAIGRITAERLNATVLKVFRKPHSATTSEREDFQEILDFIKTSKKTISYYIVKSIDRLTRVGYPEYLRLKTELGKLGVSVIDSYGVIQPTKNTLEHLGVSYKWSNHSPSEAGEMLEAYKGKVEVRDILTRLIGAEVRLTQEGFSVRRAPDGLRNKSVMVDGKKKIIREADPERVHYFQKMFELLAEGNGFPKTVEILNAMGFRTQEQKQWDRTDKEHPKVTGRTHHCPIKLQLFDGIVSVDTFNRANGGKIFIQINSENKIEILHDYSSWNKAKRLKDNPKYPWKVIRCPYCNQEMLASASSGKLGKHDGYHCGIKTNTKRAHKYFRVKQKDFEENVNRYFENLKFQEAFMKGLELHLIDEYRAKEKEIVIESSAISRSVSELKAEQAKKLDDFGQAESVITKRMIEKQIESLDEQIKQAESTRNGIEINEKSIKSFIHYAKHVMEHPTEILTTAEDLNARRAIMSLFFEEMPTYHQILNGTPKLQPLFRLSEEFKQSERPLVTLRGVEPRFKP